MNTINSFKGYGKVDEREELEFRRKTRRRLVLIAVSAAILIAVIVGAVVGTVIHKRNSDSGDVASSSPPSSAASLKTVCSVTQYPESCFSSIQSLETSNTTDPEDLFKLSLKAVSNELNKISSFPGRIRSKINDEKVQRALAVCEEVIGDAIERLGESISAMDVKEGEKKLNVKKIDDLKTWLSTSITDQDTCLDAIEELKLNSTTNLLEEVKAIMKNSTEFASNSLAIVAKLLGILGDFDIPIHRKLLGASGNGFPYWVHAGDRRLLQEVNLVPNVTVAKGGGGDVETIGEAVAMVPKKSKDRFVIYVKEGEYVENVNLEKADWNVMMYGDGKTKTIISGSKNFIDGTPTFSTATFAVAGRSFIAKDIAFRNTAGAEKHQAVAMRSGSDQSVFYRCSFDGFQDTLYAHSNRQFYRDCDVTGTIDFIFGNSAVVFQGCTIMPRQPLANQFVTITAQGKKDINQNTGISIQKCVMSPLDKLTAKTYLGRPWKEFSTTVIMQTNIDGFLHPAGWIPWVSNIDPPGTIFYGEYQNTGPGAAVDQRVKWAGYRPVITEEEATKFTVQSFIDGNDWLPMADVTFDLSL